MRTIGITRFLSRTIIWTAGIVGVFLLAVFGWFIWGIIQLQDHPIFAGGRTMSLEPIHLEVGDKHLRIPKAYMDYRPNWKGGKQDGAGMQVILPDMKPFGADTIEEFKKPGHANKFRVLINEGGIVRKNEATERKIAKTNQRIRGLAKSSKERNFDGLVENNICFFTKRDKKTDYFVGIQTDYSVIEFRCSRHKDVPHPSCSTIRNYSRLTFLTYHFSRDHLPRWREIDAAVFKLIKSFEFDANTAKPQ